VHSKLTNHFVYTSVPRSVEDKIFSAFSFRKRSYCPQFVRPSVTASTGVVFRGLANLASLWFGRKPMVQGPGL
jgi:hypothetical protein